MTVKELKQKLEGVPDTMDVMIYQNNDEFSYSLSESAEVKEVKFYEGEVFWDDEKDEETPFAMVDCFVISDDI